MKLVEDLRDKYRQHDPKYENPFPSDHVCLSGIHTREINKPLPFYTIYKCTGFEELKKDPNIIDYGKIMNEKDFIDLIFPDDYKWGYYNRYHGVAMTDIEYKSLNTILVEVGGFISAVKAFFGIILLPYIFISFEHSITN